MFAHLIDSVKKRRSNKQPQYAVQKTPQVQHSESRKDRLLSCPDHHHHRESELLEKFEKLLNRHLTSNSGSSVSDPVKAEALLRFEAVQPPPISLANYLSRMIFYLGFIGEDVEQDQDVHSDLSIRYILAAILYLERIQENTPGFVLTMKNIHRILITGVLVASKILDDIQPRHKYFADLGGVSGSELTQLEIAFLQLCHYNVNIDPDTFSEMYALNLMERERLFSENALMFGATLSPKRARSMNQLENL